MTITEPAVLAITLGSFFAAFVNAAFATGGVYIVLFTSISVLPVSAAIPLQSAFAAASLLARIHYFWAHIDWRLVRGFALGGVLGVTFGTRTFVTLPETVILVMLGIVLLVLIWMPVTNWRPPIKHPFFFVGILHSFLGAIFGVGGVLQPLLLRTSLTKAEITGTLAACMLTLDVMKATGYVSFGFSYLDYIPHIIGATLAGFAGTWAGKRISHRISEELFRRVFRVLVSVIAVRMIFQGLSAG